MAKIVGPNLTDPQAQMVQNLLDNGAGMTYSEIAELIQYEDPETLHIGERTWLEDHLLSGIVKGEVRRVWNNDVQDHFYMSIPH